jgi:hypothetical protein
VTKILIIGLEDGAPTALDGKYLVEYDPTRPGVSPDGLPMTAHVAVTDDPEKAARFPTLEEALETWRLSHGLREDGKPNRPLTAFGVEFVREQGNG